MTWLGSLTAARVVSVARPSEDLTMANKSFAGMKGVQLRRAKCGLRIKKAVIPLFNPQSQLT
jgi:hypothetical protein